MREVWPHEEAMYFYMGKKRRKGDVPDVWPFYVTR